MSFTSAVITDQFGGPENPYSFAQAIQFSQPANLSYYTSVLFNKGRYFEVSIASNIIKEVSELSGAKIEFGTMIVDNWRKLEDFVIAMNILGYYVKITTDWI